MNTGMSKKLCMTIIGIQAIVQMSSEATNKLPYALMVVGLIVVYKVIQGYIDRKNTNSNGDPVVLKAAINEYVEIIREQKAEIVKLKEE